jgi:hypothetical protein
LSGLATAVALAGGADDGLADDTGQAVLFDDVVADASMTPLGMSGAAHVGFQPDQLPLSHIEEKQQVIGDDPERSDEKKSDGSQ